MADKKQRYRDSNNPFSNGTIYRADGPPITFRGGVVELTEAEAKAITASTDCLLVPDKGAPTAEELAVMDIEQELRNAREAAKKSTSKPLTKPPAKGRRRKR